MTDKPHVGLPPAFWRTLSPAELERVFASGELDRVLCRRLWRMMDYQGKPPTRAEILVNKRDVDRLIAELKARR
jgi:hypothetical protein